jgi:excinuclease ABC subunit B
MPLEEVVEMRREGRFELVSDYKPEGDQPKAIEMLVENIEAGAPAQVLLGVTGSGKTFTLANVLARVHRPALVLAHNKTLAAQLYREFRDFFPRNAVEYFVSYYDYYQPEAYIPTTDTYIEKDSSINEELDKLRLSATKSLLERRDVVVVASVSCIYGIGSPRDFFALMVFVREGEKVARDEVLHRLVDIQYQRNDMDFARGTFRVRGDVVDVFPAYEERMGIRIEWFGDEIEGIWEIDPLTGNKRARLKNIALYPTTVYVTSRENLERAMRDIREELEPRVAELEAAKKLVEAQRLRQRTEYDLEMLRETGVCMGIENYSRHLAGRKAGDPPFTLLDYFPEDFLLFVDESHIALPQVRGMYLGDRSRKETLVEYGFRLPSALDNRPLRFEEFVERIQQAVYVSATPAAYELERSKGRVVEQIIRPTGLIDPEIEVRPAENQVDDLLEEIRRRVERKERVLVTTLTKRFAEELTEYYRELGVQCRYMHADIDAIERSELLRDLRLGRFDVLIGINLLREGLDLPEVSLVGILDADKEGYLRSAVSLIQTVGRAARNIEGKVILYAERMTDSMNKCIEETNRRRHIQQQYNETHGITARSVKKEIKTLLDTVYEADYPEIPAVAAEQAEEYLARPRLEEKIEALNKEMRAAAQALEFEKAARLRDEMLALRKKLLDM